MSEVIFGLIFAGFSFLIFCLLNFAPGEVTGNLFAGNVILLIFMVAGVFIVIRGIRKIICDKKTDLNGEFCYGKVIRNFPNGTKVNNRPEYDAEVKVYIESKNTFKNISETIGFDPEKYPEGSFVAVKYYNNDINIEYKVPSFNALPFDIRNKFDDGSIISDEYETSENASDISSSASGSEKVYDPNNKYNYDYEK